MKIYNYILSKYIAYKHNQNLQYSKKYLKNNPELKDIIGYAEDNSGSSGVEITDYILLRKMIKKLRPQHVLECGTGRSTLVIAQAMMDYCFELYGDDMKLISMEHVEEWHKMQEAILPEKFQSFVQITYSPLDLYQYSFVRGTTYKDIPDLPYDFVFVDGPKSDFPDKQLPRMCNISFIQVLSKSTKPVSAIIDKRHNSVLAYNTLLKSGLVKFNQSWIVGIVEKATKDDLILLKPDQVKKILIPSLVKNTFNRPF
jgi:predicted O-methyltransferase YrrM